MNKILCSSLWPATLNLFKQLWFSSNCKKIFELVSWFHPGTQNQQSSQRLMWAVRNKQFACVPWMQNLLEMAGQQNEGLSQQIFYRPHQTQMCHCWFEITADLRLRKQFLMNTWEILFKRFNFSSPSVLCQGGILATNQTFVGFFPLCTSSHSLLRN